MRGLLGLLRRCGDEDLRQQHPQVVAVARRGHRPVDVAVGHVDPLAEPSAHHLAPQQPDADEVVERRLVHAGARQRLHEFLGAEVRARGELAAALGQFALFQLDLELVGHGLLQPVLDQLGLRQIDKIARRVQHLKHPRPLLQFEFRDHAVAHLDRRGEEVLRQARHGGEGQRGGKGERGETGGGGTGLGHAGPMGHLQDLAKRCPSASPEKPRRFTVNPNSVDGLTIVEEVKRREAEKSTSMHSLM